MERVFSKTFAIFLMYILANPPLPSLDRSDSAVVSFVENVKNAAKNASGSHRCEMSMTKVRSVACLFKSEDFVKRCQMNV